MEPVIASVVVFAAAGLSLLLALVVLGRGWEDRRHQLLALFLFFLAVSWGGFAMSTAVAVAGRPSFERDLWISYSNLWFPGLALAALFLTITTRAARPPAWTHPALVCVGVAAYAVTAVTVPPAWNYGADPNWGGAALSYVTWGTTTFMGIVPLVFLRRATRAGDAAARESSLLLGVGIAASTTFHASRELTRFLLDESARPTSVAAWGSASLFLVYALGSVAFVAALWIGGLRGPAPLRTRLRTAAALLTGALASGVLAAAARTGLLSVTDEVAFSLAIGLWALWMFAAPAILAYAILLGRVQGLETRARAGVRRGTIASAFVAVFFVASEGAQQVFAGSAGPWAGLLATGALVFALAPLQRVAERIAQTAIPSSAASPGRSKEDAYRNALRLALRDRALTREEEVHLMQLADELGLGARRALELRHEVESERSSAAPASSPQ